MFGEEPVDACDFGAAGQVVEGSVALAEGDDVVKVFDDGEEIAEAPNAALVDGHGGGATLLPEPAESAGVRQIALGSGGGRGRKRGPWVDYVVQTITVWATKDTINGAASYPGATFCASELMCL